jgi:hypothetical protein
MLGMKFHFTIRDLFWLILVAALAVGWFIDKRLTRGDRLGLITHPI